jgi:hypothetical protein
MFEVIGGKGLRLKSIGFSLNIFHILKISKNVLTDRVEFRNEKGIRLRLQRGRL